MARCFNPKNQDFKYYGGRGIKVCERWHKFENFLADVGEPPPGLSIDRYPDKNGDYEPGNWRWATQKQQVENRRSYAQTGYRQPSGEKSPTAKLSDADIRQMRRMKMSQAQIAAKFGVSQSLVSMILNRVHRA